MYRKTPDEVFVILRESILAAKEENIKIGQEHFGVAADPCHKKYLQSGDTMCAIGTFLLRKEVKNSDIATDAARKLGVLRQDIIDIVIGFDYKDKKDYSGTYYGVGIALQKFI